MIFKLLLFKCMYIIDKVRYIELQFFSDLNTLRQMTLALLCLHLLLLFLNLRV